MLLINGKDSLATLSLSTADVQVLLRDKTMLIAGRLGSLALKNDSIAAVATPDFNQILSIEGSNFAEFRYETFDPDEKSYAGINSSVTLKTASIKIHYLEEPLHNIYLFVAKLAKLKGLYDSATQVAVQRASEIERMQFDVVIKTPIVIFPCNAVHSLDVLVLQLGEINARNSYEAVVNKITASLRGIQLVSKMHYDGSPSVLQIINDIDVTSDIVQTPLINRAEDSDLPDTQVPLT